MARMKYFWSLWGAALIYLAILPYFSFMDKLGIFTISFVVIYLTLFLKDNNLPEDKQILKFLKKI